MNKLQKVVDKRKKRVGRGYGSGKGGHTSGRGMKGQKARSKINVMFEGVKVKKSLLRRLPLRRGKSKLHPKTKPLVVKLELLNLLPEGTKVDIDALVKAKIVNEKDARRYGVKILGNGQVNKKVEIHLPISKAASGKVLEAGGKIIK